MRFTLIMLSLFVFTAPALANPVTHTALNDGTLVLIDGQKLLKVSLDGNTVPADDGVYTLKDGKQLRTERGLIVR